MALNDGVTDLTGLRVGGVPTIGGGGIPISTGNYFTVGNNGLGNVTNPYPTITAALAQCVASRGDVIIVQPGYTETISAAAGLTLDKIGVSIVGLGNRGNRPVITMGATAATIAVTAASCSMTNIAITCSIDEVVSIFNVTASAFALDRVDYVETATFQAIQFLKTSAAGTRLLMQNCFHVQATAPATAAQWISLIGADRSQIVGNTFLLTMPNSATSAAIGSVTTAPVNILIQGNNIVLLGGTTIASGILLLAATSGFVCYNNVGITATSQTGSIALASCYGAQNFTTNLVNTNGILDPAADT